ncbi:MAG: hypothetical protein ACRDKV_08960, partial [Solirubrobacterales bacterium]
AAGADDLDHRKIGRFHFPFRPKALLKPLFRLSLQPCLRVRDGLPPAEIALNVRYSRPSVKRRDKIMQWQTLEHWSRVLRT